MRYAEIADTEAKRFRLPISTSPSTQCTDTGSQLSMTRRRASSTKTVQRPAPCAAPDEQPDRPPSRAA